MVDDAISDFISTSLILQTSTTYYLLDYDIVISSTQTQNLYEIDWYMCISALHEKGCFWS